MMRLRWLMLCALGALPLACGGGLPGEPGPPPGEVYRHMEDALTREGQVAIVRVDVLQSDRGGPAEARTIWVDMPAEHGRIEQVFTYSTAVVRSVSIVRGGTRYSTDQDATVRERSLQGCDEVQPRLLTLYMSCIEDATFATTPVTVARTGVSWDGRKAIVLITKGKYAGIDSTITFDDRLYLDAETYLPVARARRGTDHYALGPKTRFSSSVVFRHEFVPRATLATDFFDSGQASYRSEGRPLSPP